MAVCQAVVLYFGIHSEAVWRGWAYRNFSLLLILPCE